MNERAIEVCVVFVGTIWLLIKFFRKKDFFFLLAAIFIVSLELPRWPLFLPYSLSLAIPGIASSLFAFCRYIKHLDDKSYLILAAILLMLSIAVLNPNFLKS